MQPQENIKLILEIHQACHVISKDNYEITTIMFLKLDHLVKKIKNEISRERRRPATR